MADRLKSIADRIRASQQGTARTALNDNDGEENKTAETIQNGKEVKEEQKRSRKKHGAASAHSELIEAIMSVETDEKGGTYMHLRISRQMHKKLLALKLAKISAQKFGTYALMQLFEEPEIKIAIKKILNGLE